MIERPVAACYGCKKRAAGCQAGCPDYKEYREKTDLYQKTVKEERNLNLPPLSGPVMRKSTYKGEVKCQDDMAAVTLKGVRKNKEDVTLYGDVNEMRKMLESALSAIGAMKPLKGSSFSGLATCKSVKKTDNGFKCVFTVGETQYVGTVKRSVRVGEKVILKGEISGESKVVRLEHCEVMDV